MNKIEDELEALDTGKQDKLTAGSNIQLSGNTISATDTTYGEATRVQAGLMSVADKEKADCIASYMVTGVLGAVMSWAVAKIETQSSFIVLYEIQNATDQHGNRGYIQQGALQVNYASANQGFTITKLGNTTTFGTKSFTKARLCSTGDGNNCYLVFVNDKPYNSVPVQLTFLGSRARYITMQNANANNWTIRTEVDL